MIFRRRDKLHKVREMLYFQQTFVVLGYQLRLPATHVIYFAVFAIEMYGERRPVYNIRHPRYDVMYVSLALMGKGLLTIYKA